MNKKLIIFTFLVLELFFIGCDNRKTIIACGGGGDFICPDGMFCKLSSMCGGRDKNGFCEYQDDDCPGISNLVCGCDGKPYTNECLANAAGITVANNGKCIGSVPKL